MRSINLLIIAVFLVTSVAWAEDNLGCSVEVHGFHFGDYNSFSSRAKYANSTIDVNCEQDVIISITLDAGENAGIGDYHNRKLISDNYSLMYNLYIDAACTKVWGDGTNNTYTKSGKDQVIIYGKIPQGQKVKTGYYSDRITVTVKW